MSGISSTSGSSAASTADATTYGTNLAPISFPGIASGLDYTSIIDKYATMTMQQAVPFQNELKSVNAQQTELLKIQNLLSTFQDTFAAVSDGAQFSATSANASSPNLVNLSNITGQTAAPGSYTINSVSLATSTQITGAQSANAAINPNVALADAGFSITPQDGTNSQNVNVPATLTIDGVQISIDVNNAVTGTYSALLNDINSNSTLQSLGVSASMDATTGAMTITQNNTSSNEQPLTIGSAGDVGNLLQALKLDSAPVSAVYAADGKTIVGYTATSGGPVAGINPDTTFDDSSNAGFSTAVTGGTFTVNGVQITIQNTQNLNDVISAINASAAGVIASFNTTTNTLTLTNKTTGSQSIALGSSTDTSNFLQAAGFLANYQQPGILASGASGADDANEVVGQPASVTYVSPAGTTQTAYSQSNTVTNVIPGISMQLLQSTQTPFTVAVASDTSTLQKNVTAFISAYNAVMSEINKATQPPVVGSDSDSSTGQQKATQLTSGGVLWNNENVQALRDQLIDLVSGMGGSSSSYNSLSSIGIELDNSFSTAAATSGDSSDSSDSSSSTNGSDQTSVGSQSFDGTDGLLQSLDVTTLTAALQNDPTAVASLFSGADSVVTQMGTYLTQVTGLPTQLASGFAGSVPQQSLLTIWSNDNSDEIQSLQQQIQNVTNQANMQADTLRAEFVDSETQIAQLQSMQSSLSSMLGSG